MKCYYSPLSRRGLTLVEMLVVIAIVAILATVLLPVFRSARYKSRLMQSTSNLRQIGNSVQLFQHENGGKYPLHVDNNQMWIQQLWPYSNPGAEFIVLRQTDSARVYADTIYYTPLVEEAQNARSFAYNYLIEYGLPGQRYSDSDAPNICLVADSKTSSSLSPAQINFRNNDMANILFVDGHVELRTRGQVPDSNFALFWRGIHPAN